MTRKRYCDYCGKEICGDHYKVSLSTWVKGDKKYGGHQKLTHHADMCLRCDEIRWESGIIRWEHEGKRGGKDASKR